MASTISAGTTSGTAIAITGDTSGQLELKTNNGTTALTIDTSQNVTASTSITTPTATINNAGASTILTIGGNAASTVPEIRFKMNSATRYNFQIGIGTQVNDAFTVTPSTAIGGTTFTTPAMVVNSSGNVGVGTTPKAWSTSNSTKALQISSRGSIWANVNSTSINNNWYLASGDVDKYIDTAAATRYVQDATGIHQWLYAASGSADATISFSEAMRITSGGNLLIGGTSDAGLLTVNGSGSQGTRITQFQISGVSNIFSTFYVSADSSNGAATAVRVGQNTSTSRSINAGGTVNASGNDYAEYMVKAGNFVIAKGDVCGIDANGKLTNVFSDAISFVVKSTDPSYVGGDTWGTGFDDDAEGLEAARQTVDRIAFSGQVPVNVTGATAGQYIIPVNDNGAIKGEAVSNPTFEQYQLAVGKVIAVEADGRAKIIVKVA